LNFLPGHAVSILPRTPATDVPPLPPHISLKQARNFMKAMLSGDPAAGSAIASTSRELVGAILPGKRDA
jgi:pyruvate dehydrogenase (quinone)